MKTKITILIIMALVGIAAAAPAWIPAELASKLDASPKLPPDDSIKNILVPDYEARIAALDTGNAVIKRHLHQLYDNVILLYQQYNGAWQGSELSGSYQGFNSLQEDMDFYLPLLEAGSNPEDYIPGRWMNKAYMAGTLLRGYWVMVPRNYTPNRTWPVLRTFQIQGDFIHDFKEVVTNTDYIAYNGYSNGALIDMANDLNVDPYRTYITGFSQGGHGSLHEGWWFPHRYAAVAPSSPDLRLPNQWFWFYNCRYLKNVPTRIIQGIGDGYIDGTYMVYETMVDFGCDVEFMTFNGGHNAIAFSEPDAFKMISSFLREKVLNPYPTEVYHVIEWGLKSYSRAFWVDGKVAQSLPGLGIEGFNPVYHVSVDKATNTISIDSSDAFITAFDFYLDSNLVDMSSPVTVVRNGSTLFDGAVPANGVVSVIISDTYNIPPTETAKGSTVPAIHASSGITTLQWQQLDSVRCERFDFCNGEIPAAIEEENFSELKEGVGASISVSPNPFNPVAIISIRPSAYSMAAATVAIYNANGVCVASSVRAIDSKTFVGSLSIAHTAHTYTWNAASHPSGTYIVRAKIGDKVYSKRITLMK